VTYRDFMAAFADGPLTDAQVQGLCVNWRRYMRLALHVGIIGQVSILPNRTYALLDPSYSVAIAPAGADNLLPVEDSPTCAQEAIGCDETTEGGGE